MYEVSRTVKAKVFIYLPFAWIGEGSQVCHSFYEFHLLIQSHIILHLAILHLHILHCNETDGLHQSLNHIWSCGCDNLMVLYEDGSKHI